MFKVSVFEPKVLSWWISQRAKIDMNPPYQRKGKLWSKTDKAFLIDSILNDFDIPKIYIADFTFGYSVLNTKKLSYAVIDGKQRFEAFLDFYAGELVLNDDFILLENPSLKLGGLGYNDLKKNYPVVAEKFDNFHLSVMRVLTDEEKMISELFIRLNRSKPLTGAELRNAMTGVVSDSIRQIIKHEFFSSYIKFSTDRGEDLNTAAKFLLFEYYDSLRETKKSNLDKFAKEIDNAQKQNLELATRRVIDVLERMVEIFLPKDRLLASSGTLPVYYWLVRQSLPGLDLFIREFLIHFERKRKNNRDLIKSNAPDNEIDKSLVDYDNYNRSTNDQKSHQERYNILKTELNGFTDDIKQTLIQIER